MFFRCLCLQSFAMEHSIFFMNLYDFFLLFVKGNSETACWLGHTESTNLSVHGWTTTNLCCYLYEILGLWTQNNNIPPQQCLRSYLAKENSQYCSISADSNCFAY